MISAVIKKKNILNIAYFSLLVREPTKPKK